MLSSSFAFRRAVAEGRHLLNEVTLTLADGTVHILDGSALTMGGITASGATSKAGTFSVGSAVVGTAEITLANYGGEWDEADFTGAEVVVKVGYAYDDGTTEMLRKGVYGVEQPESYDSTITLELRDNMRLFERDYSEVTTTYPATLQTIVRDVCQKCGVTMLSASFPRDSQMVASRPSDDNTSCLDVLAWAAQMAGCFCDIDPWGRLRVRWYDTSAFESEDWLDGGTYDTDATPYSDGDVADGGWFHGGGDQFDGGVFVGPTWATIMAIKSLTVVTDDVVVTGVRVVASDQIAADGTRGADGETYLYGTDGYVLEVSGNPLIMYGTAQSVATTIGPAIVGMRFRPLAVTCLGDPTIEPGDPLLVIDRRQRTYRSWATSLTWKAGGIQSISCDAETPARNRADSYSAVTREIVQFRNGQRAEKSARELAVRQLARELSEAGGLYKTEQEQQDHSVVYYLHDKPTLAESQIVWKMTSAAFGVSVDGGLTYPFGFDAWGNAILNAIYAVGIDGQYITLGSDSLSSAVGDARKVATDYITDGTSGTDFAAPTGNAKMRILPTGMEIFDGNNDSALFVGLQNSNSIVRVGKASGSGNVVMSSEGYVDVRNASTVMAHFGYGEGKNNTGGISTAPYYDIGIRKSSTTVGNYSLVSGVENTASGWLSHAEGYYTVASNYAAHAEGIRTTASGYSSHAEGNDTTASGNYSHAEGNETTASNYDAHAEGYKTVASGSGAHAEGSFTEATGYNCHAEGTSTKATYNGCHAEGNNTTASGSEAHAEGNGTEASGNWSHAEGVDTVASGDRSHAGGSNTIAAGNCQTAIGEYNVSNTTHTFIIGCGSSSGGRRNALYVSAFGNLWINGTLTQGSDRRLKEHHSYLAEDACDFVRALKPALFTKDGERHVGFYAQNVQEAEPEEWDTVTVTAQHTDESLDFDPLTLDYNALIAPLVAYAQQLEKRIDEQQQAIEAITKRLDALEGR